MDTLLETVSPYFSIFILNPFTTLSKNWIIDRRLIAIVNIQKPFIIQRNYSCDCMHCYCCRFCTCGRSLFCFHYFVLTIDSKAELDKCSYVYTYTDILLYISYMYIPIQEYLACSKFSIEPQINFYYAPFYHIGITIIIFVASRIHPFPWLEWFNV